MTTRNPNDNPQRLPRRELMKAAAAGAGLALFPVAHAVTHAIAPRVAALRVAVGYLPGQIRGAQSPSGAKPFVDAASVTPAAASYELRLLSASTDQPLSIDAQYPFGAEHHFWQAWNQGSLLQHSPPSAIRWWGDKLASLPLLIWYGGSSTLATITARPGTYALMVAAAGQTMPAWSSVLTQGGGADGTGTLLVAGGTPLSIPYFVFQVRAVQG